MNIKRIPLALAMAAMPMTLCAQESGLPPVVVTGSKINELPSSVRIDDKSMGRMRAVTSDTASLLADIPGVSLYGAGGVSSLPAIHGLADDRLRVKVDGMDLVASCPNHMNPPLSYVDPSNLGMLKVYAGVTPVSVGGDSIGGTIVAETPRPEFAAPAQGSLAKGQAGGFYRGNNNARGGNVSATYASETVNVTYSGAYSQADNYTAGGKFKTTAETGRAGRTLPLDEVGSSAYETRNHTLGLAWKSDRHLVEAKLGYQDIPYELYPNQRMDMLGNEQKRFNLRYVGRHDWGELEGRVYHETVSHHMDFGDDKRFWYGSLSGASSVPYGSPCSPIGMSCAAGMPMDTESTNTGAAAKASIDLSTQDLLRVGGEFQRYRLDDWWPPSGGGMWPATFQNIKDGKRDRTAVFGEWERRVDARWMTLAGLRYERVRMDAGNVQGYSASPTAMGSQYADANAFNARNHERTDNNVDVTVLSRYTMDATRDVEFGFARKVRSPNLYERYTWSTWAMAAVMNNFVGDGNGYVGNLDLKPEKAHTLSATFDWHEAERSWEFRATPYYTRVTDYVDAVRRTGFVANQFNVLGYANQTARLYGLDLSGRVPLARTGVGELGIKGLVNYTNGKNLDTGDELYNIMPLNAKFVLTHKIAAWDNGLEVVGVSAKSKVSDARNEIKTPGYGLVNLRASYSWKQARVDFGVENLFDRFYYLPTGGAYAGQGRTMGMNSIPWGIAVPGMGRSLYAGLTVRF